MRRSPQGNATLDVLLMCSTAGYRHAVTTTNLVEQKPFPRAHTGRTTAVAGGATGLPATGLGVLTGQFWSSRCDDTV